MYHIDLSLLLVFTGKVFLSMKKQITEIGYKKIIEELNDLENNKRPVAVDKLQKARSMGDLSENSAYTTAKEELNMIDGRINEIKQALENSEVVKTTDVDVATVSIGNNVVLSMNGQKDTFELVGEYESDPMHNKISETAPLGKALIGKKTGDTITVETPSGTKTYTLLSIS